MNEILIGLLLAFETFRHWFWMWFAVSHLSAAMFYLCRPLCKIQ